ncbi:MAG: SusD/RagB family nutrient-binding outer membrane lipoprotein [Sphingobacteriales bacterium]|nr:MAG: SusD/RagB family nutrient-binding outer membrane lipoprotein [Sphingobacteriales bacterium]
MKKLCLTIASIALIGSQYSCKKTLDVNKNPNDPAEVTIVELLPSAELTLAHQYGNYFQIVGGVWGQYWTKILQGFTYQLLTDNFGDIPFSEALKGQSGITSPKYDKQQDVYAGIIALVKEGRDLIDENAMGPSTDDLILQGDMATWGQFANTLLLRMYLRMAYVNPGAANQGIAELNTNTYGYLASTVQMNYANTAGNYNPLYSEIVGLSFTTNLVASATAVDQMLTKEDPRLEAFYTGTIALEQGYYSTPTPTTYSKPSSTVGGDPADPSSALAPVKLISSYESLFLQAEAAARTGSGGADVLYGSAIQASMDEYGADPTDYVVTPYPTGGSIEDQVKAIITEKWFAMDGNQNIEAWTEWRRTGYPDFFTISRNSRIGNVFPVRLPYPESEVTRNLKFPGQKAVTDKVWWDVN